MASFDLDAAMTRLVAMEKEALAAITTNVDAVTYFPYEQDGFPYWTNRLTIAPPSWKSGEFVDYVFSITGRLVVAHLTEGYRGEGITKIYQYIPEVLDYFDNRPFLTSTSYPTELDDVSPDNGLEIVDIIGPAAYRNDGIGSTQVGIEVIFRLPFLIKAY